MHSQQQNHHLSYGLRLAHERHTERNTQNAKNHKSISRTGYSSPKESHIKTPFVREKLDLRSAVLPHAPSQGGQEEHPQHSYALRNHQWPHHC